MKTYNVTFIGIFYRITDTVEAENEKEANLKLYEKYETLHSVVIAEKE